METLTKLLFLMLGNTFIRPFFAEHILEFEFEKAVIGIPSNQYRRTFRSNASHYESLKVYEGDIIRLRLCPLETTFISIMDIIYSNDGGSDIVNVTLEGSDIGSLVSLAHTNYGEKWNDFLSGGQVGLPFYVEHAGTYMLINIQSSDCYGIELDKIILKVDTVSEKKVFWCGFDLEKAPTQPECN
ncbi:hypothetical protein CHS0354_033290 [Potamilus streckersoni]|uniref:Uncharacterized protein n=1 Tax=Potamilus streckersoni TaxID=2493646 RepID=A0AAE0VI73_9BIVA|nr:hypothetical protein CHS0354_033290 [Potamilus streckersoni]